MMKTNPAIILYLPLSQKSASVIVKYGHFRDLCKDPLQNIYLNHSNPNLLIVIKHDHDTVTFHPLSRNLFVTSKSIESGTDDLITSDSDYDSILFQSLRAKRLQQDLENQGGEFGSQYPPAKKQKTDDVNMDIYAVNIEQIDNDNMEDIDINMDETKEQIHKHRTSDGLISIGCKIRFDYFHNTRGNIKEVGTIQNIYNNNERKPMYHVWIINDQSPNIDYIEIEADNKLGTESKYEIVEGPVNNEQYYLPNLVNLKLLMGACRYGDIVKVKPLNNAYGWIDGHDSKYGWYDVNFADGTTSKMFLTGENSVYVTNNPTDITDEKNRNWVKKYVKHFDNV